MRKFYIENEKCEKRCLNTDGVFFCNPAGLGFENSNEYGEASGYFLKTKSEAAHKEISGTLVFLPKGEGVYSGYRAFADFVLGSEKLVLHYCAAGDDWYSVDVDVTSLEKGEISQNGALEVPISFAALSPVYQEDGSVEIELKGIESAGDYKRYYTVEGENFGAYKYGYEGYRYANISNAGENSRTISAQMPCDFEMTIKNPVVAPVLTVYDGEEIIGRVDLSATAVREGEKLVFSTRPSKAGAYIEKGGKKEDLTAQIGLSMGVPTFFQIPPNRNIKFKLTAQNLEGVNAGIKIFKYFRTV